MENDEVTLQEAENALSALTPIADTIDRYAESKDDCTALLIVGGVDNGDTVSTHVSLIGGGMPLLAMLVELMTKYPSLCGLIKSAAIIANNFKGEE